MCDLKEKLLKEVGMDEETVEYLWEIGVISEKETKRWLLQSEYYRRLKKEDRTTCFQIAKDLADEFNVSHATANNYIYYHTHVA